jgi:hypothetical protein
MLAMLQRHRVTRMSFNVLLLVSATLLIVHGLAGHAHGDLLAPVPVAEHAPGDDHHDTAGGSCDIARVSTDRAIVAIVAPALAAVAVVVRPTGFQGQALDEYQPPPRLPLFLLHAALLI